MPRKTLNDYFPEWDTAGIFAALQGYDVPWKNPNIATSLDMEYHGNHSGDKLASPLLNKLSNNALTSAEITAVCNILFAMYNATWTKEYATLSAEYNPIENYDMTENMTNDITTHLHGHVETRVPDLTDERTPDLTDERTPDLTEINTPLTTKTTENNVFGFNSATESDTGGSVETMGGTDTTTNTGTDTTTHTGTDTTTHTGTDTTTHSGTDTDTRNYTLTRSGNIGVTTSQQMLQSERELWMWNYFYNIVFPDIDRVLCLKIY